VLGEKTSAQAQKKGNGGILERKESEKARFEYNRESERKRTIGQVFLPGEAGIGKKFM